jgi:hypothetical protein
MLKYIPEDMSGKISEKCQIECQKIYQIKYKIIYQIKYQKIYQIECQMYNK